MRLLAGPTSAWAQRPLVVEARLAPIGSPSGVLGVGLSYSVQPWLAVSAGAGFGVWGPQFDVMARLRAVSVTNASGSYGFYLGVGGSEGAFEYVLDYEHTSRAWKHAWWGNLELGFEKQWYDVVSLRVYVGNEWNLSRNSGTCHKDGRTDLAACGDDGHTWPYLGVAMGYGF